MKPRVQAILAVPLLFLGVAGHASIVMAQSAGTFTATGDMNTERAFHRATLLPNGKVLITGFGFPELYDPATGKFTLTGNMTPFSVGSTTLLPDGRVLVASGDRTARAWLYDPDTGIFSATGAMTTARESYHAAALLANGKVLIVAGEPSVNLSAELYDLVTGKFAATGTLAGVGPYVASVTLLPDGRVLVAGYNSPDLAGLYDPGVGTFTPIIRDDYPHASATLLPNGKVLLAGLTQGDGWNRSAEVYDPSTGTFTPTGSMITARADQTATLLPDGTVLLTGSARGALGGAPSLANAELYDPVTGAFFPTGDMTIPRYAHTGTLLPDGTVLIAGGLPHSGGGRTARAELYHPAVVVPGPMLFSLAGDGRGQGAILHAGTAQVASVSNPAIAGEALEIYLTGLMDASVIPPQVAIGGRMAEVLWFGNAPGFAGLNQVNVRVPSGVAPGSAAPVRLMYLGRLSNEVTIGVQ